MLERGGRMLESGRREIFGEDRAVNLGVFFFFLRESSLETS